MPLKYAPESRWNEGEGARGRNEAPSAATRATLLEALLVIYLLLALADEGGAWGEINPPLTPGMSGVKVGRKGDVLVASG